MRNRATIVASVMAMGISMVALAGADDPACPTGGVFYMQNCEPEESLAKCLECYAGYPAGCPDGERQVTACETLCNRFPPQD